MREYQSSNSYDDAFRTLSRILRRHRIRRLTQPIKIAFYALFAVNLAYNTYTNMEYKKRNQRDTETNITENIAPYDSTHAKSYEIHGYDIGQIVTTDTTDVSRMYASKSFNQEENLFKPDSALNINEYRNLQISYNALLKHNQ